MANLTQPLSGMLKYPRLRQFACKLIEVPSLVAVVSNLKIEGNRLGSTFYFLPSTLCGEATGRRP